MFANIENVPEKIREFYKVETYSEPTGETKAVEYQTLDEAGNPTTGVRMVPVYVDRDHVVEQPRGESKSLADVWRVVRKHRGARDDLVCKWLAEVCRTDQWEFHDEYLAWYQRGLELEAVVLPEHGEGQPDPFLAHQERIVQHEAQEPIRPSLIDVPQWFYDNARDLRRYAYAEQNDQDEMWFDDQINGTTTLIDHNKAIKAQYPFAPEPA